MTRKQTILDATRGDNSTEGMESTWPGRFARGSADEHGNLGRKSLSRLRSRSRPRRCRLPNALSDPNAAAIGNPFLFAPSPLSSAVPVLPALTPTGRYLYVPQVNPAGSGYQVVMLNALSGAIVGSPIPVGNVPVAAAMAPNGRALYVSNSSDATVTVVNTKP
jgi:hypothetical protein